MRTLISTLVLLFGLAVAGPSDPVEARAGYASWLKHNNAYRVTGDFAGYNGSLQVQVKWRGNRFVVVTPLGTFPLKRNGNGVTFRLQFEKAWATVNWVNTRATVVWKGQRGVARVKKIPNRAVVQDRGNTLK